MADRALGNPLGNPLGLASATAAAGAVIKRIQRLTVTPTSAPEYVFPLSVKIDADKTIAMMEYTFLGDSSTSLYVPVSIESDRVVFNKVSAESPNKHVISLTLIELGNIKKVHHFYRDSNQSFDATLRTQSIETGLAFKDPSAIWAVAYAGGVGMPLRTVSPYASDKAQAVGARVASISATGKVVVAYSELYSPYPCTSLQVVEV